MSVTRRSRPQARSEFKSVRLDPQLRARLREAARVARVSESDLVREAIARKVDAILSDRLDQRLADVIGVIAVGGGYSERTGEAFKELLRRRKR